MSSQFSALDLSIVLVYLAAIVGLGCVAGRFRARGGEGSHYFLAGNTLGWPVIGLAMFAANISTVHDIAPGTSILGLDPLMFFITALGVLTGAYTMIGGLLAVVWTESIQAVLLPTGTSARWSLRSGFARSPEGR